MASLEDEIRDLKEKNNELVQKVQFWKVAAASKENEKLELMKEINELRLKLSRIRSGGAAQARKLDTALQTTSEEALTHLVKASSAVARTIELAKTYMQERQDLDNASPRWSALGGTPNSERVHRVPPLLIGGQPIQPVVSLSRTMINPSSSSFPRTIVMSRSPNQVRNVTERAVPVHMLQDVYIPLTRIDVNVSPGNNMVTETGANDIDNSAEDLGLEDVIERSVEDSQNMSEGEDFETSRTLEAVVEDLEPEDVEVTPPRSRRDNPLEGPSWLLDRPSSSRPRPVSDKGKSTLEPDSTTRDESAAERPALQPANEDEVSIVAPVFSPTVRRRARAAPPADAGPLAARRNSASGRVLKVLVAKMRLSSDSDSNSTPPKRPHLSNSRSASPGRPEFDAPSPNGATDARVIVFERKLNSESDRGSGSGLAAARRDSRQGSHDTRRARPRGSGDGDKMTLADAQPHTKTNQSRLNDSFAGECSRDEDEMMIVTYRGGRVGASGDADGMGNVSHRGPKTRESKRDEASVGDESRGVGDESGGAGSDGEGPARGRARRPRKKVVYKEKPLNRKMRR